MHLTAVLSSIVIALVSILVYLWRRNLSYWKDRGIPYVEPHPIYGNLKGFRSTRVLWSIINDVYEKLKGTGPFCGFYFMQRPAALVLDKAFAKDVLIKDFSNFANRGVFHNEKDDPLTGHLFALDGTKWKQLRQKLTPTFTSGKMKFMFPIVVNVGEEFVAVMNDLLKNNDNTVEIKELLARFTTDVIGTCAFGIECKSLRDPNAEFRMMGRSALATHRHGPLVTGLMASFPGLARKLHMRHVADSTHEFFMRIVRETVDLRERNGIKRNDFMDLLIELKTTKSVQLDDGEVLTGLTVEELAAQAFVFFLAGFETSSTTMSFALYELACRQDIQNRLRTEINEVFEKHHGEFTYECMKQFHYMDQIIKETLRLYTVVPFLQREAIADYQIDGHPKYGIEKGTLMLIPASSFHLDSDFYPAPFEFNPERFAPDQESERDSIDWLPFGEGPRNCIGKRFGEMQVRVGLALLLRNFKFSIGERTLVPMEFETKSFVLSAKGGIYLQMEKV